MINDKPKLHVAIIMDGNGRWAQKQNLNRSRGHLAGVKALQNLITKLDDDDLNIKYLSFFAFSTENWKRDQKEVSFLMNILLKNSTNKLLKAISKQKKPIKIVWTGFNNQLDHKIVEKINYVVEKTKNNKGIIVNFCFNYGGLQDIYQAALQYAKAYETNPNANFKSFLLTKDLPDVDLLIRTGNEKRISNFLIAQSAYAEIIFEPAMFPDYTYEHLKNNLLDYQQRDRRFGLNTQKK